MQSRGRRRAPAGKSGGVFPFARGRPRRKAGGVPIPLALSTLCENPDRRTGLSTFFPAFVAQALTVFPDVHWLVFAGPDAPWPVDDPRVGVVRDFPANNRPWTRLRADHFCVGGAARGRGAAALLTVGFMPLRTAGLPVVMHAFVLPRGSGLRGLYRRWAVRRGCARAALVIANSRWAAAELEKNHSLAPSRRLVSPEGLDHARFAPEGPPSERAETARALGLPPRYLLWVSNFYAYKRAELALAAYARLAPELRAEFPLVLAGGDWRGGLDRARAAAARLGVTAEVRFLGWIGDRWLPALYRGARAHVLSTAEETFGKSVTEAMACGCPCVLQDLPVLREVAEGAAEFVDFGRPERAASALEKICRDDAHAAGLRAAGLARAAEFGYEKLARERVTAILARLGGSA